MQPDLGKSLHPCFQGPSRRRPANSNISSAKLSSSVPFFPSCLRHLETLLVPVPQTRARPSLLTALTVGLAHAPELSCVHGPRLRQGGPVSGRLHNCCPCDGQGQPSGGWMGLLQTGTLASQVRNVCPHNSAPEKPPSCLLAPNSERESFLPALQPAGLPTWNVLPRWREKGCVCEGRAVSPDKRGLGGNESIPTNLNI